MDNSTRKGDIKLWEWEEIREARAKFMNFLCNLTLSIVDYYSEKVNWKARVTMNTL